MYISNLFCVVDMVTKFRCFSYFNVDHWFILPVLSAEKSDCMPDNQLDYNTHIHLFGNQLKSSRVTLWSPFFSLKHAYVNLLFYYLLNYWLGLCITNIIGMCVCNYDIFQLFKFVCFLDSAETSYFMPSIYSVIDMVTERCSCISFIYFIVDYLGLFNLFYLLKYLIACLTNRNKIRIHTSSLFRNWLNVALLTQWWSPLFPYHADVNYCHIVDYVFHFWSEFIDNLPL